MTLKPSNPQTQVETHNQKNYLERSTPSRSRRPSRMQKPIQYISLFSRSVSVLCNPFTMDLSRHYVNRPPFIQDCIRLFCSAEISFLQLYNWHFIQNAANRKGEKGDQIISWSSTHPPYPLIHHMTTPIAKAVINPSTIHFHPSDIFLVMQRLNSHPSSTPPYIDPPTIPVIQSLHPKSSSTSLILIHLHPSMATPAATAVPAGAASAATHRPQPCFHTQVGDSTCSLKESEFPFDPLFCKVKIS